MPFTNARIKQQFAHSIELNTAAEQSLLPLIKQAGMALLQCLLSDHKILCYGHEDSTFNAQYFASLLVHRLGTDRPSLPVIPLTSAEKQLYAFGNEGDILVVFCTRTSKDVLSAIDAAHAKGVSLILLTGKESSYSSKLDAKDIELCAPTDNNAKIHELALLIIHCFCDIIDTHLFASGD